MAEENKKIRNVQKTSEPKPYFSKSQTFSLVISSIIISAIATFFIIIIALPLLLKVSFVDLYSGNAFKRQASKTIIKTNGEETAVEAVAKKLSPSVVNIRIKKSSDGFFGSQEEEGEGSGVIFRKDGYILTNNHVVDGAKEILVTIGDDQNIKATIIGADSELDIAVIKVERNNLQAAEIEKRKPHVGELAVAIGSPLGFDHTVTSGIVSAVNRVFDVPSEDLSNKTYTDLIQTDTAINPGNSGGALANSEGKVIGINTLIASQSGGSEGIGFAILIARAVDAAEQLMKLGKVSHPYIGIFSHDLTEEYAKQNNLPVDEGAIIEELAPGGPAAKAGIKPKDIIIKFDASSVSEADDLITLVRRQKVGSKISVVYYRGKTKKTTTVIIAEKPKN